MAFLIRKLIAAGGQSGRNVSPCIWEYSHTDTLDAMIVSGYFNDARHLLRAGDRIFAAEVSNGLLRKLPVKQCELYITSAGGPSNSITPDVSVRMIDRRMSSCIRIPFFYNQTDLLAPTNRHFISPVAGQIHRVVAVCQVGITTGGTITVARKAAADTTFVTVAGLSVTFGNGAAAGAVTSGKPTAETGTADVEIDDVIRLIPASFASAGSVFGYVEIACKNKGDRYYHFFNGNAADVSAGVQQQGYCPVTGNVARMGIVIDENISTGGNVTAQANGTEVTGINFAVANSAVIGTVLNATPTTAGTNTAVTRGQLLTATFAAAFNGGGAISGYIEVIPSEVQVREYLQFQATQVDVLAPTAQQLVAPIGGRIEELGVAIQLNVTTGDVVSVNVAGAAVGSLNTTVPNSSTVGANTTRNETAAGNNSRVEELGALTAIFGGPFATAGALNGVIGIRPGL